ncbi:MAG: calcium/sodium antiporter [Parachlamydiales bacterium]
MSDTFWILLGIAFLYGGAEGLVHGAYRVAIRLGMTPLVAGLTVVSIGTSMPEAVASFIAQVNEGLGDLAMGNVVGSNIANIGLIAGVAALSRPMEVSRALRYRETPIMLGALVIFTLLMVGDRLGRGGGVVLILIIAAYLVWQAVIGKRENALDPALKAEAEHISGRHWLIDLLILVSGGVALVFGGWALVKGSIDLATKLGVSDRVIGLTIVAIGTSLPELATSLVAALRGHGAIALGNVVGSNLFNACFIAGGVAVISPITFVPRLVTIDAPVMLALSAILWLMMLTSKRIVRWEGGLLLLLYGAYLWWGVVK